MNLFEISLLLLAIPLVLIASGYWLASRLTTVSAPERLAVAMLSGLAVLLWTVSVVNLALPIAGIWGWVCLWPAMVTVARSDLRGASMRDLVDAMWNRRGALLSAVAVAFFGFLLWPLLSRSGLVFYDGTGNHDAFFWVTGAEHLKRQTYLQPPLADAVSPLYYSVQSIIGWRPGWGRMGSEGLLALVSSVASVSPLKLYVAATAALFLPWVAAVYLVVRQFVLERVSLVAAVALVALQPMFVFFHSNANLPNLIGILCGALAVVSVANALINPLSQTRTPWLLALALAVHGMMCSYPEMLPAIALPCAVLCGRAWFNVRAQSGVRGLGPVVGASLAGLLLNPASTLRAFNGFFISLEATRNPEAFPDIFAKLSAPAIAPAMATLSVPLGDNIGAAGGVICCGVLLAATILTLTRARDRFGSVAILAGATAIFIYALATKFGYGWQKTMQFSAVFAAAILPVGTIGVLGQFPGFAKIARRPVAWLGAGVALVFLGATLANVLEAHKWSGRKYLTRDWFAARDYSRKALRNAPVLVDTQTFARPFFFSMWATYFLTESRIYFTETEFAGGYLHEAVRRDAPPRTPEPKAILVSKSWASTYDPLRGWTSNTLVLIPGATRVSKAPQ